MEARRAQLLVKPLWGGSVCPQLHFLGVCPGTGAGSHLGEWQHTSRTGSTSPCRSRGSFGICKTGADQTRCPTRGDEPRYPALPPQGSALPLPMPAAAGKCSSERKAGRLLCFVFPRQQRRVFSYLAGQLLGKNKACLPGEFKLAQLLPCLAAALGCVAGGDFCSAPPPCWGLHRNGAGAGVRG